MFTTVDITDDSNVVSPVAHGTNRSDVTFNYPKVKNKCTNETEINLVSINERTLFLDSSEGWLNVKDLCGCRAM